MGENRIQKIVTTRGIWKLRNGMIFNMEMIAGGWDVGGNFIDREGEWREEWDLMERVSEKDERKG